MFDERLRKGAEKKYLYRDAAGKYLGGNILSTEKSGNSSASPSIWEYRKKLKKFWMKPKPRWHHRLQHR